jgi:uncharacterized membrane protein YeaQ/YmgE (transglycosylase-associated protein family)
MELIVFLVALALIGLIVGALARFALPGPDPMTIPQTIGVGIAGSFVAGLIAYALGAGGAGLIPAILVATLLVYLVRRSRGGSLTEPAPRRQH